MHCSRATPPFVFEGVGCKVQGVGCGFEGLRFKVWGLGLGVWGLGVHVADGNSESEAPPAPTPPPLCMVQGFQGYLAHEKQRPPRTLQ